jgi:hypothetical protein
MRVRALIAGLVAGVVITACSDDSATRDDSGSITEPGEVSVFDLRIGDCVETGEELQVDVAMLEGVPCAQTHTHEVFAIVDLGTEAEDEDTRFVDGAAYPGEGPLEDAAQRVCVDEFASYVDIDYADSSLFFTYLVPSVQSWQEENDRKVVCLAMRGGEPMQGSVRGSEQ